MSAKYNSRIEKRELKKAGKSDNTNGEPPKKRKMWKKVLLVISTLMLLGIIGAVGVFAYVVRDAPDLDETLLVGPETSLFFANDGETLIGEVGVELRYEVTLDQIPQVLIDAVLATEDVNFYDHFGIDVFRTVRAVWETVFGARTEGGSTITQQVVKNAFLTPEQTVTRKMQEWYLAVQLERRFSKDEILEIYFNKNLYGGRIFGVARAAERFFGIEPENLDQLTLEQAALLAGIPQSPNNFTPVHEENWERAQNRRNTVLYLMNRHGKLSDEDMRAAQAVPIEETLNLTAPPAGGANQAFLDMAEEEAAERTGLDPRTAGLRVITTLDVEKQQVVYDVLNSNDFINWPESENLESATMLMDTQTGAIYAVGAGRDYKPSGFNYATDGRRQVGSAAKPHLAYGPAINKLQWSTGHFIVDEKWAYSDGTVVGNFGGAPYTGKQTMRFHLAQSTNVPALKLANEEVGMEYAVEFARNSGLNITDEEVDNESNPLGTFEQVSVSDLTVAYAAFGNGGYRVEPHTISKIIVNEDETIVIDPEKERVMEDFTAYMVTDMLRTAVQSGTATRAQVPGVDVAGKTGSTSFDESLLARLGMPGNAQRDAWFAGYTPEFSMSVWTGYTKSETATDFLNSETRNLSLQVFQAIMSRIGASSQRFERPSSVAEQGGELFVVGGPRPPVQSVNPVSGLQGQFDPENNSINLSWSHNQENASGVQFRVTYSVDGGASQTLQESTATSATLPDVEPGRTYTFTVVAFMAQVESDPVTVTVPTTVEVSIPPVNVNANFDPASNSIPISWTHDSSGLSDVTFRVTFTVNGGATQVLQESAGMNATITNPEPGATYTITVVAISGGSESEPASVAVTPPAREEPEETPPPETEQPDEGGEGNPNQNPNPEGAASTTPQVRRSFMSMWQHFLFGPNGENDTIG